VCEIGVGFSVELDGEGLGVVLGVGVCEIGVGFSEDGVGLGVVLGVGVCAIGVGLGVVVGVCTLGVGVCATGVGSIPPCFFASPGGMQPDDPGEHPHPVLLP